MMWHIYFNFSQFQSSLNAYIKLLTRLTAMRASHHQIQVAQ